MSTISILKKDTASHGVVDTHIIRSYDHILTSNAAFRVIRLLPS